MKARKQLLEGQKERLAVESSWWQEGTRGANAYVDIAQSLLVVCYICFA